MSDARPYVYRDTGSGWYPIYDWPELWRAMWEVLAYAMHFQAAGQCWCGCVIRECAYCSNECPR